MSRFDEDYDDAYFDDSGKGRHPRKEKKKFRDGHGSGKRHKGGFQDVLDEFSRQQEEMEEENGSRGSSFHPAPFHAPVASHPYTPSPSASTTVYQHHDHIFGPNTIELNHVKIDFDGVAQITPIESYHNGYQTYGIKFLFKGKKGFYKIIWYESDKAKRDSDCMIAQTKYVAVTGGKM